MIYVHVAENHRREILESIPAAGRGVADPTHAVLTALGLPCMPTRFAPARDPPQRELCFDGAS